MRLYLVIYDGFYQESVMALSADHAVSKLTDRDRYYHVSYRNAWAVPASREAWREVTR